MQTHPKNYATDLTDEEWEQIKSLVSKPKSGRGKRGRPALDRRVLMKAIVYVVRGGCAWRLLPGDFLPWQTVYGYFCRWSQDWTWTFIHDVLRDWLRKSEGRAVAPTEAIIDSQSVKTPDQAVAGVVWALADHLGRRRLPRLVGPVGQTVAPLRQTALGNRPPVRSRQRL
jgi:putative transposase